MSSILPTREKMNTRGTSGVSCLGRGWSRPTSESAMTPETAALASRVRTFTNEKTALAPETSLQVQDLIKGAEHSLEVKNARGALSSGEFEIIVQQAVNEAVAIDAAVNARIEHAVAHELQDLASFFPSNPRQIKRIINAITIYWAVALQRPGLEADAKFRFQLAIWIIVMTEWPATWRLLVSCPELVDVLTSADAENALSILPPAVLPGSFDATLTQIRRMRGDALLISLLTMDGAEVPAPLTTRSARILAQLTPIQAWRGLLHDSVQ